MEACLKNVSKCLFLSFILSSCSPAVTTTQVRPVVPDKTLLRECGQPRLEKEHVLFGDLFSFIKSLQTALAQCNNDKRALREWRQSVK